MRQIWISRAGPPEALTVKEAPDPEPQKGEMRVRVEACGVNFADVMGRLGLYPDLPPIPVVPGYEIAGRVDAVGGGVDAGWVGRDVFALTRFGGYADLVCVPEAQVFPRPKAMSAEEGASIPINYLTAWQLMVVMGGLNKGQTVLVHSVGGGVGIAATQIAKHIGAKVIGTASAAKHGELRALGVDHLIDYRTEDFETRTLEITGGRGVELILDAVGGDVTEEGVPGARADRSPRHIRRFVGRNEQDGREAGIGLNAGEHALASIQSPLAHERQQGRFRRQPRSHVGRDRRHARVARPVDELVGRRRDQAEDRADLSIR